MNEFIIVGDTKKYKECLVKVCGTSRETAEKTLEKMLTNPSKDDEYFMKDHFNFQIKEVEAKYCWWNDPVLCN